MKICLAIFAHDEEATINQVLSDLLRQTALDHARCTVDVHLFVLCNACTDGTAHVARKILSEAAKGRRLKFEVVELRAQGKTPTWNYFMHELLPDDADFVIPLDADIRIDQDDLIMRCVEALETAPAATVATPQSLKDFRNTSVLNPLRYVVSAFSAQQTHRVGICGQFYCARAEQLRRIHIPAALHTQDGYLRAVIMTDALTKTEVSEKIIQVPNAYHYHPPHITLSGNFRYQKRQMVGTVLARLAYREMEKMPRDFDCRMQEIAKFNRTNHAWLLEMLDQSPVELRRVPRSYRMRKTEPILKFRLHRPLKLLLAPLAFMYDQIAAVAANAEISRMRTTSVERLHGQFKVRQ